jgi:hypothetical protein
MLVTCRRGTTRVALSDGEGIGKGQGEVGFGQQPDRIDCAERALH